MKRLFPVIHEPQFANKLNEDLNFSLDLRVGKLYELKVHEDAKLYEDYEHLGRLEGIFFETLPPSNLGFIINFGQILLFLGIWQDLDIPEKLDINNLNISSYELVFLYNEKVVIFSDMDFDEWPGLVLSEIKN